MRENKFRGKPTKNNASYFEEKEFVYGSLVISNDKYYILLDVLDNIKRDDYEVYMIEVIAETVGQYTELKDKNGKEIYEGDIVFIDAYTYEGPEFDGEYLVIYNELLGMWTLVNLEKYSKEKEDFLTFEDLNGWYKLDIKLLGNIYDNLELLEEGE